MRPQGHFKVSQWDTKRSEEFNEFQECFRWSQRVPGGIKGASGVFQGVLVGQQEVKRVSGGSRGTLGVSGFKEAFEVFRSIKGVS